jgi:hypothetical protein
MIKGWFVKMIRRYMKLCFVVLLSTIILPTANAPAAKIPAFPSAEGYGAYTPGDAVAKFCGHQP